MNWARLQEVGTSLQAVERWWSKWPTANIGMLTGRPSGDVVVDVDGEVGEESIRPFGVPTTPTVRSHRGLHYHFRPPDCPLKKRGGLLPGVDLQADGACAVLPPSRHVEGVTYTWVVPLSEGLAPCPDWVVELCLRPSASVRTSPEGWAELWSGVPEGARNETAARLVGRLLRCGLPPEEIEQIMLGWALRCDPGGHAFSPGELLDTVGSIVSREAARPYARDQSLLGTPWVCHHRHSDVVVYESLRVVEESRGYPPGARLFVSLRELARVSGYSLGAVAASLRRLAAAGLITLRPGRPGEGSVEAAEVRRVLPIPGCVFA